MPYVFQQKCYPYFLWLLLLSTLFISCKKFVQIKPTPNLTESTTIFSSDQGVLSAVAGLYVQMRVLNLNMTNGGLSVYTGLSADEIFNTSSNTTADPFTNNSLFPANAVISSNFWNSAYTNIYQVNSILNGLSQSPNLSDSIRNQSAGEMKFVRAFYYFTLINLFGDVPLILSTDYKINATVPRTPIADVYQQIIRDLLDAQNLLKPNYIFSGKSRPNKWTATSLLARVYLYLKDYMNAEIQSSAIINSGAYSLPAISSNIFSSSSNETIWQLYKDNSNTAEGSAFIPSSTTAKPPYAITSQLLSAFSTGDLRKTNWLAKNPISNVDYYYPAKYKVRVSSPVSEYLIVFRLAEQFLIRAEARAYQNNISGAQSDLNMIRNRAGTAGSSSNTSNLLLIDIDRERQLEYFSECGHRWFDLKRTGKADSILGNIKGANWQPTDKLYPIPDAQINLNPFLVQNPGY